MKTNVIASAPPVLAPAKSRPPAADPFKAHLIFAVGSELYACPIEPVDRVLRRADTPLQPAPAGAPPWVAGRLATNSGTLPVIALRSYWGIPGEHVQTIQDALLVVRLPGQSFVLLVESCLTVVSSLPPGTMKFPLPAELLGPRASGFDSVIYLQKSLLVTLQLHRLLSPEFKNLSVLEPA